MRENTLFFNKTKYSCIEMETNKQITQTKPRTKIKENKFCLADHLFRRPASVSPADLQILNGDLFIAPSPLISIKKGSSA